MHPHSLYAAYHIPTASLRICLAETVLHQYEHAGKNWTQQQSLTVNFTEDLTVERLDRLAELARSAARAARDRRVEQTRAVPSDLAGLLRRLCRTSMFRMIRPWPASSWSTSTTRTPTT